MPEMDGIKATEIIRTELKIKTPIIAFTANAFKSEIEKIKSWMKPIIAVCRSGARSGQATQFLESRGIDIINGGPWQNVDQCL